MFLVSFRLVLNFSSYFFSI